jgi:alpha-L-fucosidase
MERAARTTGALATALLVVLALVSPAKAADDKSWDMLTARAEVVQAWQDMRFGMFVCWGPVTLTGQEIGWSRGKARPDQREGGGGATPVGVYDNLYKRWNPDKFDARAWVRVAQEAGAKYMIFLVKHHDGFCLYDT